MVGNQNLAAELGVSVQLNNALTQELHLLKQQRDKYMQLEAENERLCVEVIELKAQVGDYRDKWMALEANNKKKYCNHPQ